MIGKILDNIIALRLIYLLVTPFDKTPAFKLGLIDAEGNTLKKAVTKDETAAMTYLHKIVFNIKRLIGKIPGGNSRIATLTSAYLLTRESVEMRLSEQESTQFFTENFDRFFNMPFEERELVEDAFDYLTEDAAANATGAAVSTDAPVVKRTRKFAEFSVDDDTFSNFKNGKSKFRRWGDYLNMEDAEHKKIYDFARRHPKGIIVLKDNKGNMKGIRYSRRGSGNWANIKRNPRQIAESVLFNTIEVQDV